MARTLPGRPTKWKPRGLSDSLDGTNSFPGAMSSLMNLIPAPFMKDAWVCRPAAVQLTNFTGFTAPAQVTALCPFGVYVLGLVAETTGAYAGKDVPFWYHISDQTFHTVTIPGGAASLPATQATTGDWTPPCITIVGSRAIITHPGYAGGANPFFGWIDFGGLNSNTLTGNLHSNTTLDSLSSNPLLAGWQPGDLISSSDNGIPANTTIVSLTATTVTLSASATSSGTGVTLTVTGGTKAAPLYGSGNTNINVLKAVPVSVGQFNGRAYYAVPGNGTQFSDSLLPCNITNATQALVPGNGLDITCFGGLPETQYVGGILQALFAFQGDSEIQQITGDVATSNLMMNAMNVGVGTLAPATIAQTSMGLAFVSPDGLRIINFSGTISDPIGANGDGVNVPFLNAVNPSRMCAAFNQNVLRLSVQNGAAPSQPVQEYWLDFDLKVWSGPHSFPAACIVPYQATPEHGFTMAANGVNAKLFTSTVTPTGSDTYTENGVPLAYEYATVLLPDTDGMCMNKIVLTTLTAAISNQQQVTIQAIDDSGKLLDTVTLSGTSLAGPIWGTSVWGQFQWGGPSSPLYQHPIFWHLPLIFKQALVQITGNSALGTVLGNLNFQVEQLGYLTEATG